MDIQQVIAAFLEHRCRRRRSPQTITQYQYQLEELWLTWRKAKQLPNELNQITLDELAAYFDYLAKEHVNQHTGQIGLAPATAASGWRVIRALWNFAARRKWLDAEQRDYFRDDELIARPALDQRMRPVLEDATLEGLLEACLTMGNLEERARDRALLLVLAESGMRVSELAGMQDEQLRIADRCAKVIGKGNREEWVYWHNRADRALRIYLKIRSGKAGGPVFRRLNSDDEALTPDDIRKVIKTLAAIAGVEVPKGAPAHSFRHRFAHKGIDAGLDVTQVGQLMRHRNQQTTMRYLRENPKRLRQIRDKMGDSD